MTTTPAPENTITVGLAGQSRTFRLQPFTVGQALRHIEVMERASNAARASLKEAVGEPLLEALAARTYLEAIAPNVVELLSDPADGGSPLSLEDFWQLDAGDPERAIQAQEDFASVDVIMRQAQLLITEAYRAVAKEAMDQFEATMNGAEA